MNIKYLISLEDKNKQNYHYVIDYQLLKLPRDFVSLQELDEYTKNFSEKYFMDIIIDSNIYPELTHDNPDYYLCVIYKDSKVRKMPFISQNNREILNVNILEKLQITDISNKTYNHFNSYLTKNHVSLYFKEFIKDLAKGIINIYYLTYEEQREIKVFLYNL